MVSASCVNTNVIAIQAHERGKLNAAPKIVSVTDSSNAFLSIFIKIFVQHLYIHSTARIFWRGGLQDPFPHDHAQAKRQQKKRRSYAIRS